MLHISYNFYILAVIPLVPCFGCGRTSDSENPKSSRSKARMNPSHMDPLSSKGKSITCTHRPKYSNGLNLHQLNNLK